MQFQNDNIIPFQTELLPKRYSTPFLLQFKNLLLKLNNTVLPQFLLHPSSFPSLFTTVSRSMNYMQPPIFLISIFLLHSIHFHILHCKFKFLISLVKLLLFYGTSLYNNYNIFHSCALYIVRIALLTTVQTNTSTSSVLSIFPPCLLILY